MSDQAYFILNIVLGLIFAAVPLGYGIFLRQKPYVYPIAGFIVAFSVVFFGGWLISLLSAAFFCLMIYYENKKRNDAVAARVRREEIEAEKQERLENPQYTTDVWSDELIGRFNQEESEEE